MVRPMTATGKKIKGKKIFHNVSKCPMDINNNVVTKFQNIHRICFSYKGVPWSHREWNEKKYMCVSPEASPMVPQTVNPLYKRVVL